MTHKQRFAKVKAYVHEWGVAYHEPKTQEEHVGMARDPGPFTILSWKVWPAIALKPGYLKDRFNPLEDKLDMVWPYLLHDLAHIVCPLFPSTHFPEERGTLGFELLSVRHLGLPETTWEEVACKSMTARDLETGKAYGWTQFKGEMQSRMKKRAAQLSRQMGHFIDGRPTFKMERLSHTLVDTLRWENYLRSNSMVLSSDSV